MSTDYIQGTIRGKLYLVVALIIAAALLAFIDLYEPVNSIQPSSNIELKAAMEELKHDVFIMIIIAACFQPIAWISAFQIFKQGKRVKEMGQYPLPGANLPFKTKIQTGDKAMMQALSIKIFAFMIIFVGLFMLGISIWSYRTISGIEISI